MSSDIIMEDEEVIRRHLNIGWAGDEMENVLFVFSDCCDGLDCKIAWHIKALQLRQEYVFSEMAKQGYFDPPGDEALRTRAAPD